MRVATPITEICGRLGDGAERPTAVDDLDLTSEERASAHFAATTAGGRRVRISLPRGTELQDGDILDVQDGVTIVVKASEEELLYLRTGDDPIEWAAACYQLGNLHRPARFTENGLLTPVDPMAEQVLRSFHIRVDRVTRPFVGRRYGAVGSGHHHHHEAERDDHTHAHDGPAGHAHVE